jgi:hypothetical protein
VLRAETSSWRSGVVLIRPVDVAQEFIATQQRHDEELKVMLASLFLDLVLTFLASQKQASEAAEAKRQRDAAEESCQALIKERETMNEVRWWCRIKLTPSPMQKIRVALHSKATREREQLQQEESLRQRLQEISAELNKREAAAQFAAAEKMCVLAHCCLACQPLSILTPLTVVAAPNCRSREEQERVKDAEAKLAAARKELNEQAELKQKAAKQSEEDRTCSVPALLISMSSLNPAVVDLFGRPPRLSLRLRPPRVLHALR